MKRFALVDSHTGTFVAEGVEWSSGSVTVRLPDGRVQTNYTSFGHVTQSEWAVDRRPVWCDDESTSVIYDLCRRIGRLRDAAEEMHEFASRRHVLQPILTRWQQAIDGSWRQPHDPDDEPELAAEPVLPGMADS